MAIKTQDRWSAGLPPIRNLSCPMQAVGVCSQRVGLIARLVACYRGLTISGGAAKAVGNGVNERLDHRYHTYRGA
jgi:hypothetical protein